MARESTAIMLLAMLRALMPARSTLTEQLATLGVHLPPSPEEPEGDEPDRWIQRGRAYAEGVRLWRAQLRNAPESTKGIVDQLLRHLHDTGQAGVWDQLVYSAIKPEVQGSPDYERWQTCTKLIRSSALTPAQLLGIALELAREQRLAAATYGFKRLLKEHPRIHAEERLQLCSEMVAAANTSRLMADAKARAADWDCAVELHKQMAGLLATAIATEIPSISSEGAQPSDGARLLSRLDAINKCLGGKGVHGHAVFIQICREKLPTLLQSWTGERPWIVEVGCSREIIEGQNSTVQLLALAKELNLPFAGIDLDQANIEALERDYKESNAVWITGKGEEELKSWEKPIAACYLDAYDFEHDFHSESRQDVYKQEYKAKINNEACKKMHLDAVRFCDLPLIRGGIITIDDTWRSKSGKLQGKGILACQWLADSGYTLICQRNKSVTYLKN